MKKIIICVLIAILLIGSVFLVLNRKDYKSVIGTVYQVPLINDISTGDKEVIITGGNYVYGDVNQDGFINKLDILAIEFIIKGDLISTESQKRLGDFNKDNKVDEKDKELLNDYLDKNTEYKYEYNIDLSYCINKEDNEDTCNWQESNYFKDINFDYEYYYMFVKNTKTNVVGTYKSSFTTNE